MPWKNQLHEVAIYAVDFMLNDLIYAELPQLDYTEFASVSYTHLTLPTKA